MSSTKYTTATLCATLALMCGCASAPRQKYIVSQPRNPMNKIAVLGEVQRPGLVDYYEGMDVVHAIASGHGVVARRLKHDEVRIIRNGYLVDTGSYHAIIRGETYAPELMPGDVVFCESSTWAKVSDVLMAVFTPVIDFGSALTKTFSTASDLGRYTTGY